MIEFDLRDFERVARAMRVAQDQVPYALSRALNDAVIKTKEKIVGETWPRSVTVRNPRFLRASLGIRFSSKRDLQVELSDTLKHVNLTRLEKGGTKRSKSGGNLAIPTSRVSRGAGGAIRRTQKPRALARAVVKGGLIFQREGSGKNARLRLMYKLQPAARIQAEVPFHQDFQRFMREEVRRNFPVRMMQAMKTRR